MDVDERPVQQFFTSADRDYLRFNFVALQELCRDRSESEAEVHQLIADGMLPSPSYIIDDGTEYFPRDYFMLIDEAGGPQELRAHFRLLYEQAVMKYRRGSGDFESDWNAYMDGLYGVCLREVTPENIVAKVACIEAIEELLANPRAHEEFWRDSLRANVNGLDRLEREFSPDYDRNLVRFDELPSRDRLIDAPRERFPAIFE